MQIHMTAAQMADMIDGKSVEIEVGPTAQNPHRPYDVVTVTGEVPDWQKTA